MGPWDLSRGEPLLWGRVVRNISAMKQGTPLWGGGLVGFVALVGFLGAAAISQGFP